MSDEGDSEFLSATNAIILKDETGQDDSVCPICFGLHLENDSFTIKCVLCKHHLHFKCTRLPAYALTWICNRKLPYECPNCVITSEEIQFHLGEDQPDKERLPDVTVQSTSQNIVRWTIFPQELDSGAGGESRVDEVKIEPEVLVPEVTSRFQTPQYVIPETAVHGVAPEEPPKVWSTVLLRSLLNGKCTRQSKDQAMPMETDAAVKDHTYQHPDAGKANKRRKPYKCRHCEKCYGSAATRRHHEIIHTGKKTGQVPEQIPDIQISEKAKQIKNKANEVKNENSFLTSEEGVTDQSTNLNQSTQPLETNEGGGRGPGDKPYKCSYCEKYYASVSSRTTHEKMTHTGDAPLGCTYCDKRFVHHAALAEHERVHTGEKPFKCKYCSKQYRQSGNLGQHERTVHASEKSKEMYLLINQEGNSEEKIDLLPQLDQVRQDHDEHPDGTSKTKVPEAEKSLQELENGTVSKPYKCNYCEKYYARVSSRTTHEKMTHTGDAPLGCTYCDKRFVHHAALAEHERVHTGEKPFKCKYCSKQFRQSGQQKHHERTVHRSQKSKEVYLLLSHWRNTEETIGQVRETDQIPQEDNTTDEHHETFSLETGTLETMAPEGEKSLQELNLVKEWEKSNQSHVQSEDGEVGQSTCQTIHTCTYCGKSFNEIDLLKTHEASHLGGKPFACKYCDQSFRGFDRLMEHEAIHTGEKPFKCKFCTKCFSRCSKLRNHEAVHTGDRKYPCSYCGKGCADAFRLKVHERLHTGEKPFMCGYCGKRFRQSGHMQEHERIHTGEKRYTCSFCGKSFTHSAAMNLHKRRHTGEKRFICRYCGRSFAEVSAGKDHERTHTGQRPFKCLECSESFQRKKGLRQHKKSQKCQRNVLQHEQHKLTEDGNANSGTLSEHGYMYI